MVERANDDVEAFPWWKRGVIYQVYPRSFQDSNGDGTGDLKGVAERLDYLSWLGIDAIWLSPFYPSPMADFGYDVSNYCDVDPLFGSLTDFDALLSEAHERAIKIVIDFVPNHTSDQHPWFVESRFSKVNPKRDWYTWRDPKPDGSPPNNWTSHFGGPAWTLDRQTGQFYNHRFLPDQPDLNWRNSEVKAAMFEVLRFWLNRGVDGFRIDGAHYILGDPNLTDNPPAEVDPANQAQMTDYDRQLHIHDNMHPDIHPLYREIRALIDSYASPDRPTYMGGETHVAGAAEWAKLFGDANDEMTAPGNFGLIWGEWSASAVRAHVESIEAAVPDGAWPNYVMSNHDETRTATQVGPGQAKVALMLLLSLRGTPMLYYGDELGMENVEVPPSAVRDPKGLRMPGLGLGRDPERTPMQWDSTANAGFTRAGVTPWLPLAGDYESRNVEAQRADPKSILNLTRELLGLRRNYPALAIGDYQAIDGLPPECYVYTRELGNQRILVALNLTNEEHQFMLPYTGTGLVITSTGKDRTGKISLTFMVLQPNEGILIDISGAKLA